MILVALCQISIGVLCSASTSTRGYFIPWQNQQNGMCAQRRLWSAWASAQSDQNLHWVLSYPVSALRRPWSDWAYAQADQSLYWARMPFVGFVMRRLISCIRQTFLISAVTGWVVYLTVASTPVYNIIYIASGMTFSKCAIKGYTTP